MDIGGLQKVSLIDYPEKICAVLFVQGCNFRCPFCHNPELVDPALYHDCIPEEEIFSFLEKRKGILDAVSISGGEPTIHPGLFDFIERVKGMNYLVKIDTNGSLPEVLKKLIDRGLLDYIAMDVKAPLMRYPEITGSYIKPARIKQSIKMIMESGIEYEFRTTVVKSLLDKNDLRKIVGTIKGARLYVLQKFVPSKSLDEKFLSESAYSNEDLEAMKRYVKNYVGNVIVR